MVRRGTNVTTRGLRDRVIIELFMHLYNIISHCSGGRYVLNDLIKIWDFGRKKGRWVDESAFDL